MESPAIQPHYSTRGRATSAIRTQRLNSTALPTNRRYFNYFNIYFIEAGSGEFWADASRSAFSPGCLLFFVPYQHIRLAEPEGPVRGE